MTTTPTTPGARDSPGRPTPVARAPVPPAAAPPADRGRCRPARPAGRRSGAVAPAPEDAHRGAAGPARRLSAVPVAGIAATAPARWTGRASAGSVAGGGRRGRGRRRRRPGPRPAGPASSAGPLATVAPARCRHGPGGRWLFALCVLAAGVTAALALVGRPLRPGDGHGGCSPPIAGASARCPGLTAAPARFAAARRQPAGRLARSPSPSPSRSLLLGLRRPVRLGRRRVRRARRAGTARRSAARPSPGLVFVPGARRRVLGRRRVPARRAAGPDRAGPARRAAARAARVGGPARPAGAAVRARSSPCSSPSCSAAPGTCWAPTA